MPPRLSINPEVLAQLTPTVFRESARLAPIRPETPLNVTALGLKFGFRIQWSKSDGAGGYNIAIMDDNNLDAPKLILSVMGSQSMDFTWFVGDVASTRQFSVQAFVDYAGGRVVSEFSVPIEATSVVEGGAGDSAPTDPPSNPIPDTPQTSEEPDAGPR